MKIGISSPYLNGLAGGERYMLTIASCLSQKHKVDVFWHGSGIKKGAEKRFYLDLENVSVNTSMQGSKINRIINTAKYDLIIYLSDGSVPVSFAKHNIFHFQVPFTDVDGKSFINQLKLKRFSRFICNSNFTKEFTDKEFCVNSEVIYPPIDLNKFKPGTKQNVILSVGRFHPLKKQNVLINAFNGLKLNDWKLVLAGGLLDQDQMYFDELNKSIKNNNISFKPNISFPELQQLYSEAKIYWHGTGYDEINPSNMEHFGITTVEAMASGCIPVTFKGGGQKEIIKHGVNGYLWKTTDELTKYTQKLVDSTGLWEKLSKQSKQDAVKYSEAKFCRKWQELVDKL